ncbi:MAG: M48 family metalloprotease, partial [Thermoanaerobaculia bacterium]
AMAGWILAGLVTMVLGRIALLRSTRMIPQAVTLGELRDRIFGMARKVRVKLQQIYILPASRMRMANAFATAGNSVILTDYLLAHLNRREVEAVVAHEVAHLRHRHPRLLGLAVAGILVAWMIGSALFDAVSPLSWLRPFARLDLTIDLLPLLLLAGLLPLRLLMRRFERSADAYAAMLTGDPEAMISALGKLARLSLLPMRWTWWEDRVSTHPSMIRRGEALALRFGLSYDRMEALLRGEAGLPEDRYELPDAMRPDRVFTTEHKTRASLAVLWAVLGVTSGTGILTSWAVHRAGLGIDESWWIYGLALLGGWAVLVLLMNLLGPRGEDELARKLAARFEREGISPDALGGAFVGFAPDDSPRLYEGLGIWDVGFLLPGRDGLVYLGDQIRFRLGHGQVAAVRLGPGTPSWWRVGSVYVDWRSAEGWTRTFHLRGRGRTLLGIRRSTKQLAEKLSAWLRSPEGSPELPAALAELPPPVIAEVTGLFPREALRPRNLLVVCWLIFVLTFFVSLLIGNWDGALTALVLAVAIYCAQIVPYFFAAGPKKKPAAGAEERRAA